MRQVQPCSRGTAALHGVVAMMGEPADRRSIKTRKRALQGRLAFFAPTQ
jgi:hypothetical protein